MSGSSGNCKPNSRWKELTIDGSLSTATPSTSRPGPGCGPSFCKRAYAAWMVGSSLRQGSHQVAQKFTMTGRPWKSDSA